jgi:Tfp pilus assembly protein PilN
MGVSEAEFERLVTAVANLQATILTLSTGQAATSQCVQTLTIAVNKLAEDTKDMGATMAVIKDRDQKREDDSKMAKGAMFTAVAGAIFALWAKVTDWLK